MSKSGSRAQSATPSGKKWADSVSVSENHAQGGIELRFNAEPHPELQSKLRAQGFLPSKSQNMWFCKNSADAGVFASQVKESIDTYPHGPELSLSPSYEPLKANLENKRFSYVLISLKDGQEKSYVVFEPSKPKAEVIAANFARNEFGQDFLALAVKPKSQLRESRLLFEEGRIITEGSNKITIVPEHDTAKEEATPVNSRKTITQTMSNDKLNPTLVLNAFHRWLKDHPEYKDPQKVTKAVFQQWIAEHYSSLSERVTEDVWDRHKRLIKIISRLGNLDTKLIVAQPYSAIYNKLMQIIPGLMEHLESGKHFSGKSKSGGHMDLHFDYLFKDKQGYNIALAHYYELNGDLVPDPDMQIRIIPEMKMAEAMTFQDLYRYDEVYTEQAGKDMVDLELKKKLNTFLNQWLSNIIADGHKIQLESEDQEEQEKQELEKEVLENESDPEDNSGNPSDITHVKIGLVEPIPSIEVDVHNLPAGKSIMKISYPAYDAIGFALRHSNTRAFRYEGKVWTITADKQGEPIMHELESSESKSNEKLQSSGLSEKYPDENTKDPLANESGHYSEKSAGKNFEVINIPLPEDCYKAEISIVKTSFGDYRAGVFQSKQFGNNHGRKDWAEQKGIPFATRQEALEESLITILRTVNELIGKNDHLSDKSENEERLNHTLLALFKYAEENSIDKTMLVFKSITYLMPITFSELVPLPTLSWSGKESPDTFRISKGTFNRIARILDSKNTNIFYYDKKAWILVSKPLGVMHIPELDKEAAKYYKGDYKKTDAYLVQKNLKERQTDVYKLAFDRLKKLIPDLENRMKGEKTRTTVSYKLWKEQKETTFFFTPSNSTLFIVEDVNGKKHMESDILIEMDKMEARVTAEWLSDYYAEGLGRLDPDNELVGDDMAIGEDMTRGLTEWLTDLLDEGLSLETEPKSLDVAHPLAFLDEPLEDEGYTGEIIFNPVAMASFIQEDHFLSYSWKLLFKTEVLPVRNTYTKEEIRNLKIFYNSYVLEESSIAEEKYKEGLASLKDISFTVVDEIADTEPVKFQRNFNYEEEKEIRKNFIEYGFTEPFTAKEAIEKNLPVVELANRFETLEQQWSNKYEGPVKKQTAALEKEEESLGKGKGDKEKKTQIGSKLWEIGLTVMRSQKNVFDMNLIFQDDVFENVLHKAKKKGLSLDTPDELSSFKAYVESAIFDFRVIEDYERQPISSLIAEVLDEYVNADKLAKSNRAKKIGLSGSKAVDLQIHEKSVPNVLVPAGSAEPFWSANMGLYDKKAISNSFPHLKKLSTKSLPDASAIEMFELVQMSHPTDYGIKVDRGAMLEEWEKRGRRIFLELGWPTDLDYPFVNLWTGYGSVEPLGALLSDGDREPSKWWAAAENWRPLADLKKGLEILDEGISLANEEKQALMNSKTGKAKGEKKSEFNSLNYDIKAIEEGKTFINLYLDKVAKRETTEIRPKIKPGKISTAKIDLEEIHLTTKAVSRDPDFSKGIVVNTWQEADNYVQEKVGKNSDVYYRVVWKDGHTRSGCMDIEPAELFKDVENVFSKYLTQYLQNISNADPEKHPLLTQQELAEASAELAVYHFQDKGKQKESSANKNPVILEGLENAYWLPEDDKYPVNKAEINGSIFSQSRLRESLLNLLKKRPVEEILALVKELGEKFTERRPLEAYDKSLVTIGKTGDKRKKELIANYVDDIIIDNDLSDKSNWPVCSFLIERLVNSTDRLVDLPGKGKPKLKKVLIGNQHELNKQIEALIDEKDKKGASFTPEDKELISRYAGSGGLLKHGAKGRGVLYEYYTPDEIVQKMWGLARKFGYAGGSVLEPAVGIGNFLKYAPKEAIVFGFETNHYAARIAQILYPHAHIHEKAFESLFFAGNIHLKDKIDHPLYSLVIGNPPYGEFTGKYAGMGEKKWTGALEYDQYFMLRGLDLLQPSGLMVFIVPSQFLTNGHKYNKTKEKINQKAELLDAYRLPGRVFSTTDIGTDILVLRRRSESIATATHSSSIDQEELPITKAKSSARCSITGLFIKTGDNIFYDLEKPAFIKAVKIIAGDNPADLAQNNPKLSSLLKKLFEDFMLKNGDRNELREKYYGKEAIYDPAMVVDEALEYIHERMQDEGVTTCWLHKIDVTEAFAD